MSRAPALVILAVMLLAACRVIHALHPLFADTDLVLDQRLVGTWRPVSAQGSERWVVFRADTSERTYVLAITDSAVAAVLPAVDFGSLIAASDSVKERVRRDPVARERRTRDSIAVARVSMDAGGPRTFEVRLGRIGGALFADVAAATWIEESHFPKNLLLPTHWFWRVSLEGDRLQLVPLDEDWLGTQIDSGRVTIEHHGKGDEGDDAMVLTASTAELQRLVARVAGDTLAFPRKNAIELRRN